MGNSSVKNANHTTSQMPALKFEDLEKNIDGRKCDSLGFLSEDWKYVGEVDDA